MDIYGLNVLARWANGFDSAAAYYRLISIAVWALKVAKRDYELRRPYRGCRVQRVRIATWLLRWLCWL
jgi:hypothetical protein